MHRLRRCGFEPHCCVMNTGGFLYLAIEADHMSIPWVAALQVARKLLPVVVDHAPELLKTIGRFRATPPTPDPAPADPAIAALQEQIDALQRTITLQADTIGQLQTSLRATKRSLVISWTMFAVAMLLSLTTIAYLLFRV